MIITYSPKYAIYQKKIRDKQVQRAMNKIRSNGKLKKGTRNPNDPSRFIEKITTDENGVAVEEYYHLNQEKIDNEAMYDGFYAVSTNLEDDDIQAIINVSEERWQIEECFRIMKTDFKARPVHLQKQERIEAHFLTCFMSLIIYRLLANILDNKYTATEILKTIEGWNWLTHSITDIFQHTQEHN